MALNDAKVKAAKPSDTAYKLADSGQLYLYVTPAGGKLWRMNYTFGRNAAGRPVQKTLSIGAYPIVTLVQAREKRDEAKRALLDGRDPAIVKQVTKAARSAAADNTFQVVACRWFEKKSGWVLSKLDDWRAVHGAARVRDAANWTKPGVRGWSAVHSDDVLKSLLRDAFPVIGALPMIDIDTPKILEMLHRVEARGSVESAHRLRQRVSDVFNFAMAAGICKTDPAPAALIKVLADKPKARKQPSIIDGARTNEDRIERMRKLLRDCEAERTRAGTKFALRLLALTAVRPGEIAGARWDEFEDLDGEHPLWRIPAARMKGDRDRKEEEGGDHLVPLSAQAMEVIDALREVSGRYELLFPSERHSHRSISENTLRALLIRAGYYQRHVPHGFRAAFSTIMNERADREWRDGGREGSSPDRAIIDLMLAHVPSNKVESAYNRAAYLDRRRELAQEWADLLIVDMDPPAAQLGRPIRYAATGPGRDDLE